MNIKDYLSRGKSGEAFLQQMISSFRCQKNPNVERFLREQSINFTRKNQSVTYIVLSRKNSFSDFPADRLAGYFTITIRPISIDTAQFSNTVKRKIMRISRQESYSSKCLLSAYLIAQLGKNFNPDTHGTITGTQLLDLAVTTILDLQYRAGGTILFLGAENEEKLLRFYEHHHFKQFNIKEAADVTGEPHTLVQMLKVL